MYFKFNLRLEYVEVRHNKMLRLIVPLQTAWGCPVTERWWSRPLSTWPKQQSRLGMLQWAPLQVRHTTPFETVSLNGSPQLHILECSFGWIDAADARALLEEVVSV